MIKRSITGLLFLLTIVCCFSSCEEDPYYDERADAEYWLCSTTWIDTFESDINEDCDQELTFNLNGTGVDHREYYRWGTFHREERFLFRWYWNPTLPNSLILDYPDGRSYFDNIRIDQYTLRGVLDDERVIFDAL